MGARYSRHKEALAVEQDRYVRAFIDTHCERGPQHMCMANEFIAAFWGSEFITQLKRVDGGWTEPASIVKSLRRLGYSVPGAFMSESRDQPYLYVLGLRVARMPGTEQ